jgi:subtilisin family serine protease
MLSDTAVAAQQVQTTAQSLTRRYGGTVVRTYQNALRGFEAKLSPARAAKMAADRSVRYVEQNHRVHIDATQSPTSSWGLDRIDQRPLPLNNSYVYPTAAAGVRAYVIDTGVRFTHQDFGGRAVSGRDTVDNDNDATDCNGHGTHVAGILGSSTYGVGKGVTIVGVRVLDCAGSGSVAGVIEGIDWVTADHAAGQPAVANMSLGGDYSQFINDAVTNAIADGITFAVAGGNDTAGDACNTSPASTPAAITVGATQIDDGRASYSNVGTCLDIFAPGTSITSTWASGDTATNTISGTSMASPHVAGAAALVLAANPTLTPQQVRDKLVNDATPDVVTDARAGSPNRLVFVGDGNGVPGNDFSVGVTPAAGSVDPGASVSATVTTATTSVNPQTVTLSTNGLPSRASARFTPDSVTSGETSTLTISTSAMTPPGKYTVTVTGVGTSAVHAVTFALLVNGDPPGSFSLGLTSVAGSVNPGSSSTTTVTTATTSGNPQMVDLSASGLPSGATATFDPPSVTSGASSKLTISTSASTPRGFYQITVLANGAIATDTASYQITVDAAQAPCKGSNKAAVDILGPITVEDSLTMDGCPGNASRTSTVTVGIWHNLENTLTLTLIAPDGTEYVLDTRGGSRRDTEKTYTVDLSSEVSNGEWRLRIQDINGSYGYLNYWYLNL